MLLFCLSGTQMLGMPLIGMFWELEAKNYPSWGYRFHLSSTRSISRVFHSIRFPLIPLRHLCVIFLIHLMILKGSICPILDTNFREIRFLVAPTPVLFQFWWCVSVVLCSLSWSSIWNNLEVVILSGLAIACTSILCGYAMRGCYKSGACTGLKSWSGMPNSSTNFYCAFISCFSDHFCRFFFGFSPVHCTCFTWICNVCVLTIPSLCCSTLSFSWDIVVCVPWLQT